MSTLPQPAPDRERHITRELPELLPARMLNEFVYCPRLFYYEWVEGVFQGNADTAAGQAAHRRVDREPGALPPAEELAAADLKTRSVQLSSERLGLIAKLDLLEVEGEGGTVTPVDYKRGRPVDTPEGPNAWPSDRVQVLAQAAVLRDNGYDCREAVLYYAATKQRVTVTVDEPGLAEIAALLAEARAAALSAKIPPPLIDSPKCPRCSLVGICLPDESSALAAQSLIAQREPQPEQLSLFAEPEAAPRPVIRQLVSARDDLRPLYLNAQGMSVGKSGEVLQVREQSRAYARGGGRSRAAEVETMEVRLNEVNQINLFGNVQISTQAVQACCENDKPICYFNQGGWFYGITTGLNSKNVFLRRCQYRVADNPAQCLVLARALTVGKIRNQRTLLQRNHLAPPPEALRLLKALAERAQTAGSLEELLGLEGVAARVYFGEFAGMLKPEEDDWDGNAAAPKLSFDFDGRNRRPPRDPVNAMLSLVYSLLVKDLTIAIYAVGLDPYWGYYHQPRFGRPALALDLMEPFRPLVGDSVVLSAVNTHMVTERDFVQSGPAVALTPAGRKGLFRAYELRMDGLVTHPLFDYRVSYRRLLEIQARLLGRWLEGEIPEYPVFETR